MKIVFDTYAWIEYFLGTAKGKKAESYFEDNEIITPIVAVIELSCKAEKEGAGFENQIEFLKSKSAISFISMEIAQMCSKIYVEQKKKHPDSGLIDAIILATARVNNARLLSGDRHFKGLKETIFLE